MSGSAGGEGARVPASRPASTRVYGPVPSRRLGRSLGVDVVPFKNCPYNCLYCQLGPTTHRTSTRESFFPWEAILAETLERAAASRPRYITISGSGEPTLFRDLGPLIEGIKAGTDTPVALLTNGALFGDEEVRRAAALADVVLPSLDAGDEAFFQWVNRPVAGLTLDAVTEGLVLFRESYRGRIWLEVMVLRDYTEALCRLAGVARRARQLRPDRIQLNTPVRPGIFEFVKPVPRDRLAGFCRLFDPEAEVVAEEVGDSAAAPASSPEAELILPLIRLRPCTLEDICAGLGTPAPAAYKVLRRLVEEGCARARLHGERTFYEAVPRRQDRATGSDLP
jgi:wyosine [tRNA(Phe)-imidazoG37] synthetase (radical SAM superfamily)